MLSKNKSKFVISLQKKKVRDEENLFVIEGDKMVREFLIAGIRLKILLAKPEFIGTLNSELLRFADDVEEVSFEELRQISTLKTPHNALAVVEIKEKKIVYDDIFKELCCALEYVQDPGNLGTIIRAAAWFGIKNIVCSPDCVDIYNPRVIQASMGAILNVNVFYSDLDAFLFEARNQNIPIFGTLLDGDPIYENPLGSKGIILLGNESKGVSHTLLKYVSNKIMIPRYSDAKYGIDSLNVGMAASIVFSEFRRR
ncbi:MAG TPA: RNA methyltransferase [Bacteroidales bacterium]|nr:RNA methyltransferase [Bacteroidales bacterium]